MMTIQECKQFFEDKGYLVGDTVQMYRSEDDPLLFARMRFLHLFFESGIQKNYDEHYLDELCLRLDGMCCLIFNYTILCSEPTGYPEMEQLLLFSLQNDLHEILLNLRFQELIFLELEAYEICHNIAFAEQHVLTEMAHRLDYNHS